MSQPRPADASAAYRYARARHMLDSPSLLGRLAAEVARMDPAAAPAAQVLTGRTRLRRSSRAGVFAGSFNPLTSAHIALAEAARAQAGLDIVVWLLAARTVDKERVERAAQPDRLAQLAAFVRAEPGYAIALTNRGLYVDEARALRPLLAPESALTFLVGFDKVVQIFNPGYYTDRDAALRALFAEATVLVAPRAGSGNAELAALLARPENRAFAASVGSLPLSPIYAGESSTQARQLAAHEQWQALRHLTPPEGLALARETAAYAPPGSLAGASYALRERWLFALGRLTPAQRRALPPLSALLQRAAATDAQGDALRAWLERADGETCLDSPPLGQ